MFKIEMKTIMEKIRESNLMNTEMQFQNCVPLKNLALREFAMGSKDTHICVMPI
jgi:hypothetical protein